MEHTSQTGEMDRLSGLPEGVLLHIISFLSTHVAARTSLVCRRFRHLWESSPFITLDDDDTNRRHRSPSSFMGLANRLILNRNPPCPILSLFFQNYHIPLETSYIASLLEKAGTFGLRRLTLLVESYKMQHIFPRILGLSSLEFLEHGVLFKELPLCTPINLKNLKSLCIGICGASTHYFTNYPFSNLDALEDLHLGILGRRTGAVDINFMTMRKLKLVVDALNFRISTPSLELFELKSENHRLDEFGNNQWVWEMPISRKAVIQLYHVRVDNTETISWMLNAIANVQELHLDITEERHEGDAFNTLLVPSVDPPTFINLKHFHLEICFHEFNVEDLVTIIQQSPALESLKLVHKPLILLGNSKKKKLLRSMLPRNAEGNYRHAHYVDLHIAEKKEDLLRKLIKRGCSKRLKT